MPVDPQHADDLGKHLSKLYTVRRLAAECDAAYGEGDRRGYWRAIITAYTGRESNSPWRMSDRKAAAEATRIRKELIQDTRLYRRAQPAFEEDLERRLDGPEQTTIYVGAYRGGEIKETPAPAVIYAFTQTAGERTDLHFTAMPAEEPLHKSVEQHMAALAQRYAGRNVLIEAYREQPRSAPRPQRQARRRPIRGPRADYRSLQLPPGDRD